MLEYPNKTYFPGQLYIEFFLHDIDHGDVQVVHMLRGAMLVFCDDIGMLFKNKSPAITQFFGTGLLQEPA